MPLLFPLPFRPVPMEEIDMDFEVAIQRKYAQLVARAWKDDTFKQRLLQDPAEVLLEEGIAIPAGVEVRVVENSDSVFYLSLPPKPSEKLSEEQLDLVSGGLFDMKGFLD